MRDEKNHRTQPIFSLIVQGFSIFLTKSFIVRLGIKRVWLWDKFEGEIVVCFVVYSKDLYAKRGILSYSNRFISIGIVRFDLADTQIGHGDISPVWTTWI